MRTRKLPHTDSIQELARFWDTHDLTEFEDELEEVTELVFERQTVIPLHLEPAQAQALSEIAKAKGLAEAELIHEWVLERIRAD